MRLRRVLTSLKRLADKRASRTCRTGTGSTLRKRLACRWRNLQKVPSPWAGNHELGRRALGHRLVRGPYAGVVKDEPSQVTSARWTRGFGTSTTGDMWTPSALSCSTHAAPPGARSRSGASRRRSSSNARALRCCVPHWCMTSYVDEAVRQGLVFVLRAADDERTSSRRPEHGARAIGKRNPALNAAAVTVARRLAELTKCRGRGGGEGRAGGNSRVPG